MGSLQLVFDREIRIFAMRRSGHHAIMYWIAEHLGCPVLIANNVEEVLAEPL